MGTAIPDPPPLIAFEQWLDPEFEFWIQYFFAKSDVNHSSTKKSLFVVLWNFFRVLMLDVYPSKWTSSLIWLYAQLYQHWSAESMSFNLLPAVRQSGLCLAILSIDPISFFSSNSRNRNNFAEKNKTFQSKEWLEFVSANKTKSIIVISFICHELHCIYWNRISSMGHSVSSSLFTNM